MPPKYDVLALGCTAVDEILYVPSYPRPDGKVEVRLRERHCGGLAATALVAAARLGARCAYAGTLGGGDDSRFVLNTFRREHVDTRHVVERKDAGPVRSVIIVDEKRRTRNIFYDMSRYTGAAPNRPSEEILRSAKVLLVDRFGIPGMIRACKIARKAGIPVVADFESSDLPRFKELLALVDHLIISLDFARRFTGESNPARATKRLWRPDRVVVVTRGNKGCWFQDGNFGSPRHVSAFKVKAVDTTGCGDVFHGVYAAALAWGYEISDRLRLASAAAALKARSRGGQGGIPTRKDLQAFLATRSSR